MSVLQNLHASSITFLFPWCHTHVWELKDTWSRGLLNWWHYICALPWISDSLNLPPSSSSTWFVTLYGCKPANDHAAAAAVFGRLSSMDWSHWTGLCNVHLARSLAIPECTMWWRLLLNCADDNWQPWTVQCLNSNSVPTQLCNSRVYAAVAVCHQQSSKRFLESTEIPLLMEQLSWNMHSYLLTKHS